MSRSIFASLWGKIRGREEGRERPIEEDILDEIRDLKRIFRKQGQSLDLFKEEILEKIEMNQFKRLEPFIQLAESFFHHDRFLRESPVTSAQEQGLAILWEKLESVLSLVGIEVIRRKDINFDPRIHEAVETTGEEDGRCFVRAILQPGYIYEGKVIKPAKALIERSRAAPQE